MIEVDSSKIKIYRYKKGKIKKILHSDFDFYFWSYEEQTKIKILYFNNILMFG